MKPVLIITLVLAVLTFAGIAVLTIVDVMTIESAKSILLKSEAVIILLGLCSAVLAKLAGKN